MKSKKTVTTMKTTSGSVTDYCGNFIYADNQLITIFAGDVRIAPVNFGNSTYWKYEYSMKDHLGNTRVVFAAHSYGQPELLQQTSYYPFGMTMQQQNFYSQNTTENKYLYNSKELQDDQLAGNTLDWYDYGARHYDAALGIWHGMDPLAESYYSQSPFHFSGNNPIFFLDRNGMNYDGFTVDSVGNIQYVNDEGGDDYDVIYTEENYSEENRQDYDESGKRPGIKISKGVIQSEVRTIHPIEDVEGNETGVVEYTHRYEVNNDSEAQSIMLFLDRNTNVEWSNTLFGGVSPINVIATSHNTFRVYDWFIHDKYIGQGFKIQRHDHSHPSGNPSPSGWNLDLFAGERILKTSPDAKLRILANQKYYPYTIPKRKK
jgi:RHS repeat-associated protein